jgi:hypothetical protein
MQFTRRKFIWFALVAAVGGVLFVLPSNTNYPPFSPNMRKGELFLIQAKALHPTQLMIGFREVENKAKALNCKTPTRS